ncbi:MAG TPA: thiol:disulfide interchange protein DsbG, partial [Usitatibacter sp.]|nr:thiol:disulfide interchange protein DsbG [Usitatibacter sp.]
SQGGIAAVKEMPPAVAAKLAANEALMRKLDSFGTPTIFYRDASGKVRRVQGAPSAEALTDILGPR